MTVRARVVDELIAASSDAQAAVCVQMAATAGEVISANLTLALRSVMIAKMSHWDLTTIRAAVERIWAELPPEPTV